MGWGGSRWTRCSNVGDGGRLAVLDRIETAALAVSCEETIATRSGGQPLLLLAQRRRLFFYPWPGAVGWKRVSTTRKTFSNQRLGVVASRDAEISTRSADLVRMGGLGQGRVFWEGGSERLIC